MFFFTYKNNNYCFIHIPKCGGKYIRECLTSYGHLLYESHLLNESYEKTKDLLQKRYPKKTFELNEEYKIIESFWHIERAMDKAHIPFFSKDIFCSHIINKYSDLNYFTFVRNPYQRVLSAFKYVTHKKGIDPFKQFIKNTLKTIIFDKKYHHKKIHYYPQYMFLCDEKNNVNNNIKIYKLDEYKQNFLKLPNLEVKDFNLQEYYDDEMLKIVNEVYKKDFELLDYEIIDSIKLL